MAKEKKKKEVNLYQIVDKNDKPVLLNSKYYICQISNTKYGKIYKSLAAVLTAIRKTKEWAMVVQGTDSFKINETKVMKDDFLLELLSLKIRVFAPSETKDLTFYLDKI